MFHPLIITDVMFLSLRSSLSATTGSQEEQPVQFDQHCTTIEISQGKKKSMVHESLAHEFHHLSCP